MSEQTIINRQQLTFMVYNFIAFTLIFSIFGFIIFTQTKLTLFSKSDADLLAFQRTIEQEGLHPLPGPNRPPGPPDEREPGGMKYMPNPRIVILTWDANQQLQSPSGTTLNGDYFAGLSFQAYPTISSLVLNDLYHFRTVTFPNPDRTSNIDTIQLLINVDGEEGVMATYQRLLIICSGIFILLSLTASYLLSRKTMRPIIRAWNKQIEFVEHASHELRTPLTIIQNKLELLLTTPYEKIMDKVEPIALTLSETRRLSKLTSDLLTLARANSSQTQLVKQPLELDTFVSDVCQPYEEMAQLQNKKLWLHTHADATIAADPNRMHQLLVILLDNALKYTGKGDSIIVKTTADEHKVTIEISDTGIGISDAGLSQVFTRFYREDKARSRATGGAGLGLSIAHWIVESHRGTIQALHNKPKGAVFKIRLPKN